MLIQACSHISTIAALVMVAICALAFLKGGPPERAAALVVLLTWLGLLVGQRLTGELVPEIPFLLSDIVPAIGFLALAVRYGSIWLGVAMMLEAALFFLHATHMSEEQQKAYAYLVAVNLLSVCVLALLGGATVAASWRRWRTRRAAERGAGSPPDAGTGSGDGQPEAAVALRHDHEDHVQTLRHA
jgi:hypothetical protein